MAERIAAITPLRTALIPAVKPLMAFTPTERSVEDISTANQIAERFAESFSPAF